MAIQIIQTMVGYQLMTIMVSTIKAHHLTGGSLPLATFGSGNGNASELYVHGGSGGFVSNGDVFFDSYAVRPLVCIPTSVFNSKYATSTTLVDE